MTQKKIIVIVFFLVYCVVTTMGQSLKYYNADDFPLIGKMSDDTEGRYARLPLSCKEKSKKWVWVLGLDSTMVGKSQNEMSLLTFEKSKQYANKKYKENEEGIHSGKLNYMFLEISKDVRRKIQPIGK